MSRQEGEKMSGQEEGEQERERETSLARSRKMGRTCEEDEQQEERRSWWRG